MTNEDARTVLVEALQQTANVFSDPDVSERLQNPAADVAIDELKLDSLDLTEWCIEIENRTDVGIDPAEIAGARTLSDLVELLTRKTADLGQPTA